MMCGGFTHGREATEEDQEILRSVKSEIERSLSTSVSHLHAHHVMTQVVAGVNYLMKVKADDKWVHVKIAKPLPHTGQPPFVMAVKHENVHESSPLEPFE
jgi:hypothetical protein